MGQLVYNALILVHVVKFGGCIYIHVHCRGKILHNPPVKTLTFMDTELTLPVSRLLSMQSLYERIIYNYVI